MIRDITIGQYYPVESVIHRLDPRTKLAISFLYIISLFLANNKYMYLLALAALVVYIGCSKVPLKFMLKGLKGIAIFILFSVVLNMFLPKEIHFWISHLFIYHGRDSERPVIQRCGSFSLCWELR